MKTYVTYGLVWALAGAVLTLALFFLGFHADTEKLQSANWISLGGGIVISVACLMLGTKARASEVPATEAFGYGRALAAGVMITIFATLFGVIFNFLYSQVIHPGMQELQVQAQLEKMEASGVPSAQIDAAEGMIRTMMHPALQAVFYVFGGVLFGTIISLITSIFLRRPAAPAEPPAVTA